MNNNSNFASPAVLDDLEVYNEPTNAFKEAYRVTRLFRNEFESHLKSHAVGEYGSFITEPKNLDGRARVIGITPGPYSLTTSVDNFRLNVDGTLVDALDMTNVAATFTAQDIVDAINGDAGHAAVVRASVVCIDNEDYVLIETKSSGISSSITRGSGDEVGGLLGIASGPVFISEQNRFNTLLTSTTDITGLDNNIIAITDQLLQYLREISEMFTGVKKVHQLEFIENSLERTVLGREIANEFNRNG